MTYCLSTLWALDGLFCIFCLTVAKETEQFVCLFSFLVLYLWEGQLSDCWKLTFFFLNLFLFQCHWSWIHLSRLWLPLCGTVCFSSCHAQYRIDSNPSEEGFAFFQTLQITETLLMGRSRDQGSKKKKGNSTKPRSEFNRKESLSLWSLPFPDKNEMKISCLFLP